MTDPTPPFIPDRVNDQDAPMKCAGDYRRRARLLRRQAQKKAEAAVGLERLHGVVPVAGEGRMTTQPTEQERLLRWIIHVARADMIEGAPDGALRFLNRQVELLEQQEKQEKPE